MLHIDLPTIADIEALAAVRATPAVSIYLRTTPLTQDAQADRIELKNLLGTVVTQLEQAGTPKRTIEPIVADIEALAADDDFWASQANSLAIFATPERVTTYRLGNHLHNIAEVSDRFHIKPLLRAVTFPHTAYILALSAGAVRLVELAGDSTAHTVRVPGLPKGMSDALGRRSHTERSGDMVSQLEGSESALLAKYARAVDEALRPTLTGHHRPLILAAAEPLASAFRRVASYRNLADEGIAGSADHTPDHELAAAARPILDRLYAEEIARFAALFAEREPQRRAITDVSHAARAATYGAVDTLLVDIDTAVPGYVHDDGGVMFEARPDAHNYGVVDEIARRTLATGGRVLAVRRDDIPGHGDLAAVLRYPF